MNRAFMRAAGATFVALFSSAQALAQPSESPPPSHSSVDGNGVDVITGEYYPPYPSISIGSGPGSLSYSRSRAYEHIDSMFGGITSVFGGDIVVTLLGASSNWELSGGVYSSTEGRGGALIENAGGDFVYTTENGTVAYYESDLVSLIPSQASMGRITSVTFPTGEVLTYAYDEEVECTPNPFGGGCMLSITYVRPASVSSTLGYKLEYDYLEDTCDGGCDEDWYSATDVTVKSQFTSGTWQSLEFDGADITDADGGVYTYTRDGSDRITGVRFPGAASNDITIAYDGSDRVTSVTRYGLATTYSYSDAGSTRTTTITHPGSTTTVVTSNTSTNRVSSSKNALNQTTSFTYDGSGRLTATHAPEGNYTKYTYDSRGNVTEVRNYNKANTASILSFQANYPSTCTNAKTCNQPTWTKDALGNQTDYTYNSTHGGVLTVKAPSPGAGIARPQTTYTYTSLSTYATSSSAYRVTAIAACSLTSVSTCSGNAAENKVEVTYGADDRLPATVTNKAGNGSVSATSSITYDYQRRPISVDGPLSGSADTTKTFYNVLGQVTGTIGPDPDGGGALKYRAAKYTYNARNQPYLTQVGTTTSNSSMASFSALQSTTVAYDSYGRTVKSTFAASSVTYAVTQTNYNSKGLPNCVARRMNPGIFGGTLPDACSLGTTGSYGQDRISQTVYDSLNRPITAKTAVGTSVAADTVATTYTTNGQVATLTDGEGNKTTYEYDAYDRRYKTRYPSKTSAGTSSSTDYEQWAFNNNGAVTSFTNRAGQTITYTLDNLSRVTGSSGSGATTRTRTYDNLGRITALTGGKGVSYTYDALGRVLTEAQEMGTVSYEYDAAGRQTKITWPDSYYVNYDYDVSGAVTKVRDNGATSGLGVMATYEYDDLGRRTKLTHGNGIVTDYGYDGASRLTDLDHDFAGTANDLDIDFSYNPAGQITQRVASNDLYSFLDHWNMDADAIVNGLNQATSVDSKTVTYDAKGNVTSYDGDSYTYDAENFMTAVNGDALLYDAAGRLYELTNPNNGKIRRNLYAGDRLIAIYNGHDNDELNAYFIHGASVDEPIAMRVPDGKRIYHVMDERGSVIAAQPDSGTIWTVENTYDAYGRQGGDEWGRFGYTGQVRWGEIGLHYYKARWYNPELGRFMQADPIGYGDGMNMYGYVSGDPVNARDPSGTEDVIIVIGKRTQSPDWYTTQYLLQSLMQSSSRRAGSSNQNEQNNHENETDNNPCDSRAQQIGDGLESAGDVFTYVGLGFTAIGAAAAPFNPVAGGFVAGFGGAISFVGGAVSAGGQALQDYNHGERGVVIAGRFIANATVGRIGSRAARAIDGAGVADPFIDALADTAVGSGASQVISFLDPQRC